MYLGAEVVGDADIRRCFTPILLRIFWGVGPEVCKTSAKLFSELGMPGITYAIPCARVCGGLWF